MNMPGDWPAIGARFLVTGVTLLALAACGPRTANTKPRRDSDDTKRSIGTATMTEDGTIIMDLRAEGPDGALGDARFVYHRGDKDYDKILKHIGGLVPGQSKPVPPW